MLPPQGGQHQKHRRHQKKQEFGNVVQQEWQIPAELNAGLAKKNIEGEQGEQDEEDSQKAAPLATGAVGAVGLILFRPRRQVEGLPVHRREASTGLGSVRTFVYPVKALSHYARH